MRGFQYSSLYYQMQICDFKNFILLKESIGVIRRINVEKAIVGGEGPPRRDFSGLGHQARRCH